MKLSQDDAMTRLRAHDHGVLCTVHADRGVDAVPVVYAVHDGYVGIPIDRVKPKASSRLQRRRNLEADPRSSLLIEHWDPGDWSRLWWVRGELRWDPEAVVTQSEVLASLLAARYPQYVDQPFTEVLVLRIIGILGWSGAST